jgi:hypothetical protein
MTNLDHAITLFHGQSQSSRFDDDTRYQLCVLSEALEEIRNVIYPNAQAVEHTPEQPAPQSEHTFEPWHDVVEIVGPDAAGDHGCIGFEGFVTRRDEDNYLRVQLGEDDRWSYFPASSLRLVYRLKPRAQEPQPVFNMGDWAEELPTGNKVQILKVFSTYSTVEDNSGRRYNRTNGHLKKIDPAAPRFMFGDRVRHYEVTGLFVRYIRDRTGLTKEQCQFLGLTDNNIHTCYAEELSLLDEIPF